MNVFQLFVGSFHSADAYRHMRKTATFGMGYTLLLVAVCTLAVTLYYGSFIHREIFGVRDGRVPLFDDMVKQIAAQVPLMTLKDHRLITADAKATTIKISGSAFGESFTDFEFITIDTTGATTHQNMKTPIVITADDVIYRTDSKTEIKTMKELTEDAPSTLVINRAMAEDIANTVIDFVHKHLLTIYLVLGSIAWFFFAAFVYVMRIFMLLALGLIGLAIGSITKNEVNYAAAVSLAALSYTPVALLDTVLFAALGYAPSTSVLFVAGCVTLFTAIKASKPIANTQME
jgi:hypothetical protein